MPLGIGFTNPMQELIAALQGGVSEGSMAPLVPMATAAAPAPIGGLAALERRMMAQPFTLQQEQRDPGRGRAILAALADALSTYATGIGGGPDYRTNASEQIAQRREQNRQVREQNRLGQARAAAEADRQSAMLEYQRLQNEKAAAIRAQEREEARQEAIRKSRVESSRFIAGEAGKNIRQKNQIEADKELAQLKGDIKIEEIKAKPPKPAAAAKPDPNIAKQAKKAEEVMKLMDQAAGGLDALLTRGEMTPDDVRRTLQREMDARGLEGEDRQRVINFFAKHFQPILKKYD